VGVGVEAGGDLRPRVEAVFVDEWQQAGVGVMLVAQGVELQAALVGDLPLGGPFVEAVAHEHAQVVALAMEFQGMLAWPATADC